MAVYLEYGINPDSGEMYYIESVKSGRTDLQCPFCSGALIARKGAVNTHHFSHDGNETCRSQKKLDSAQLPMFDSFDVLDASELKVAERIQVYGFAKMFRFDGDKQAIDRLYEMGLLDINFNYKKEAIQTINNLKEVSPDFVIEDGDIMTISPLAIKLLKGLSPLTRQDLSSQFQKRLTDATLSEGFTLNSTLLSTWYRRGGGNVFAFGGREFLDNASIQEISDRQEFWFSAKKSRERYLIKNSLLGREKEDLDFLLKKIQTIDNQKLYLIKFHGNFSEEIETYGNGEILKIGMTSRNAESRAVELLAELNKKHGKSLDFEILYEQAFAGRIEKLLHEKYRDYSIKIGRYQEFFSSEIESDLIMELKAVNFKSIS